MTGHSFASPSFVICIQKSEWKIWTICAGKLFSSCSSARKNCKIMCQASEAQFFLIYCESFLLIIEIIVNYLYLITHVAVMHVYNMRTYDTISWGINNNAATRWPSQTSQDSDIVHSYSFYPPPCFRVVNFRDVHLVTFTGWFIAAQIKADQSSGDHHKAKTS